MTLDYFPLPGTAVEDLDTPALIVNLDVAEANIRKLQDFADAAGVGIRPHAKTHKSVYWANRQLEAGAIGLCAAKVGEAEALAAGGIKDIMIPNQVIGRTKINRLMGLAGHTNLIVAVDSEENVRELSEAAQAHRQEVGVIIEINVGMNRCGVEPGNPAVGLAKAIDAAPGLRFDGVMGYEGHIVNRRDYEERKTEALRAMDRLVSAVDGIAAAGLPVNVVSAAGTGTYAFSGTIKQVTDLQCGSYIFMDGDYLEVFEDFRPALNVLATVISRPVPERAVIDVGLKAISTDRGLPKIVDVPGAECAGLSEEHGRITLEGEARKLRVGDKMRLLPMHGDTTINLHTHYFGIRDRRLETVIEIVGRGRFR